MNMISNSISNSISIFLNTISSITIVHIVIIVVVIIFVIDIVIITITVITSIVSFQEMFRSREYCADIWVYLHRNRAALTNPLYMDPSHEDTPTTHSLIPPLSQLLRNVTLWTDYFYRYCSLPTIVTPPTQLSDYLYESGV